MYLNKVSYDKRKKYLYSVLLDKRTKYIELTETYLHVCLIRGDTGKDNAFLKGLKQRRDMAYAQYIEACADYFIFKKEATYIK